MSTTKYELTEKLNEAVGAVKQSATDLAEASNQQRPFKLIDFANVFADTISELEEILEVLIDETSLDAGSAPEPD